MDLIGGGKVWRKRVDHLGKVKDKRRKIHKVIYFLN